MVYHGDGYEAVQQDLQAANLNPMASFNQVVQQRHGKGRYPGKYGHVQYMLDLPEPFSSSSYLNLSFSLTFSLCTELSPSKINGGTKYTPAKMVLCLPYTVLFSGVECFHCQCLEAEIEIDCNH